MRAYCFTEDYGFLVSQLLFENAQAQALSILDRDQSKLDSIIGLGAPKKYWPLAAVLYKYGVTLKKLEKVIADAEFYNSRNFGSIDVNNQGIVLRRKPDKVYDFVGKDVKKFPLFLRNLIESQSLMNIQDTTKVVFNENGLEVRQINSRADAIKYGASQRGFPGSTGDWCIADPTLRKNLYDKYMGSYKTLVYIIDHNRSANDPLGLVSVFYGNKGWLITDKLNNENDISDFGDMKNAASRNAFFEHLEQRGFYINQVFGLKNENKTVNKDKLFIDIITRRKNAFKNLSIADFLEYMTFKADNYKSIFGDDADDSYVMTDDEFLYAYDVNPAVVQQVFERGIMFSPDQLAELRRRDEKMFTSYVRHQGKKEDGGGGVASGDLFEYLGQSGLNKYISMGFFKLRQLMINSTFDGQIDILVNYDWPKSELLDVVKDIDDLRMFTEIKKKVGDISQFIYDRVFSKVDLLDYRRLSMQSADEPKDLDELEEIFSQDGEFMVSSKSLEKKLLNEDDKDICVWLIDHGADASIKLNSLKKSYKQGRDERDKKLYYYLRDFDYMQYRMQKWQKGRS